MSAPIIITDEINEAIEATAKALAELRIARTQPHNWKWVVIALQNALQSYLVLTLRFTSPALIARVPSPLRKWNDVIIAACNLRQRVSELPIEARDAYMAHAKRAARKLVAPTERAAYLQRVYDEPVSLWDYQLLDFGELFKRVQKGRYALYTPKPDNFPLPVTDEQKRDVALLTQLRNEYIHFTPKSLIIHLEGSRLPRLAYNCATIMLYLVERGSALRPSDKEGQEREAATIHILRAMQEEARTIAAEYGTPI